MGTNLNKNIYLNKKRIYFFLKETRIRILAHVQATTTLHQPFSWLRNLIELTDENRQASEQLPYCRLYTINEKTNKNKNLI